ncbi:MAG: hypothetical protein GTN36_02310 [Candidatus Aenigmarchaeota archaeon]|nr:hypothetical protein [Candidatus Aenigmarchaeota archaeon]
MEKWVVHASHAPKAPNDNCTICHSPLNMKCQKCIENSRNIVEENCSVSIGKCNHAFHHHCISRWISEGSNICPIDTTPWSYKVTDCNESDWSKLVVNNSKKSSN